MVSTLKGLHRVAAWTRDFLRRLQPRWGWGISLHSTQGSSSPVRLGPTLGWGLESRWDSKGKFKPARGFLTCGIPPTLSAVPVGDVFRASKPRGPRLASGLAMIFILLLAGGNAFGLGVGWGDSSSFTLDTTGVSTGTGGVGWSDSSTFTLDTTGVSNGTGGVAWSDSSGTFTLDTTGVTTGNGGVAWSDSGGTFTLDTTGIGALGGVAWADSARFILATTGVVDGGVRLFDGVSVVSIACQPPAFLTSPLRFEKYGGTFGILLVPPNAANASKFRIQTASGVKAWQKLP